MAKPKKPHKDAKAETEDENLRSKPNQMFEQNGKDSPDNGKSQIPDKNPGKVQPGHRDREEI
ncbi:MAG: hypothetical protein WEE89_19325 [Gemmatimonadota bacterium]